MAEFDVESLFRSLDTDRANVVWKWKLLEELKQAGLRADDPRVERAVSSTVDSGTPFEPGQPEWLDLEQFREVVREPVIWRALQGQLSMRPDEFAEFTQGVERDLRRAPGRAVRRGRAVHPDPAQRGPGTVRDRGLHGGRAGVPDRRRERRVQCAVDVEAVQLRDGARAARRRRRAPLGRSGAERRDLQRPEAVAGRGRQAAEPDDQRRRDRRRSRWSSPTWTCPSGSPRSSRPGPG